MVKTGRVLLLSSSLVADVHVHTDLISTNAWIRIHVGHYRNINEVTRMRLARLSQ